MASHHIDTGCNSSTCSTEHVKVSESSRVTPRAVGHYARTLTPEEVDKLNHQNSRLVSEFRQLKLEQDAEKSWDLFYKRNTTKFYKDRHWTTREFQELSGSKADEKLVILECGCGVGNFMFPLLEECSNVFFYACDFSRRAIEFVKENPLYCPDICHAFQCDLTKDDLTEHVFPPGANIVSLIFVLSSIHPDKMVHSLKNIYNVLKDDGCVIFRDYGLYDQAMLRFGPGNKLKDNLYVRQDNTRAYYFSEEKLAELFETAGFHVERNEYVMRETVNKKEGICVPRVFIQGKFTKKK